METIFFNDADQMIDFILRQHMNGVPAGVIKQKVKQSLTLGGAGIWPDTEKLLFGNEKAIKTVEVQAPRKLGLIHRFPVQLRDTAKRSRTATVLIRYYSNDKGKAIDHDSLLEWADSLNNIYLDNHRLTNELYRYLEELGVESPDVSVSILPGPSAYETTNY